MGDLMTSDANKRYYVLMQDKWIVAYCMDTVVVETAKKLGIPLIKHPHDKFCWHASTEQFNTFKPTLDKAGYVPYSKPAQTDYKVTTRPENSLTLIPAKKEDEKTYTIEELSNQIAQTIKTAFPTPVWIKGVVTDFKDKNHVYLTLLHYTEGKLAQTDIKNTSNTPKINSVIWQGTYANFLSRINLGKLRSFKDRDAVRVLGRVEYYSARSQVSFYIDDIDENFTTEEKLRQREEIRAELIRQNIYENNKRLPEPLLPLRIALFSNMNAAGNEDFYKNLQNSGYSFKVTLFPVTLQGSELEASFMNAFALLDQIGAKQFDCGVIVRGGGSSADLWDFNNLRIAEYIAKSPLKFYCGIGHDKDSTIIDDISHSLSTPSLVFHHLVTKVGEIDALLKNSATEIQSSADRKLAASDKQLHTLVACFNNQVAANRTNAQDALAELKRSLVSNTKDALYKNNLQFRTCVDNLKTIVKDKTNAQAMELADLRSLISAHAAGQIQSQTAALESYAADIRNIADQRTRQDRSLLQQLAALCAERLHDKYANAQSTLDNLSNMFKLLSPEALLVKGYAIVYNDQGHALSSVEAIRQHDTLIIRLKDGNLRVTVDKIEKT